MSRFLLVYLRVDSLLGKDMPKQVKNALEKFQHPSDSSKALEQVYDEAYDNTIERIESQLRDHRERARKILVKHDSNESRIFGLLLSYTTFAI